MNHYLNIATPDLEQNNGYWTAKEIQQQPEVWAKTAQIIEQKRNELAPILTKVFAQPSQRIILTGAGTSAYVGLAIAPHISKQLARNIEAIATTDLVSNPEQYFAADVPTLLISYARSGNSPESLAAVKLADQMLQNCHHLIITCNPDGQLTQHKQATILLMPEATLDQSFAMTSSFTSMMLATLCLLTPNDKQLEQTIQLTQHLLNNQLDEIKALATKDFNRIVFLGSGGLAGIAKEAALKMLELSAGKIDCYDESILGFRHGPKSIVNRDTLIMLLNSQNKYRQNYENDLLDELMSDNKTEHVYALNKRLTLAHPDLNDVWLSFPYIVYCQALAFYKSLALRITPDNPCPSGEVNRVVQGVNIYPYQSN